jgi:hypothetical protein
MICSKDNERILFTKAGSLWVAWVKMNLIKGRCFSLLKVPFLYHLVLEKNSAASRIS